MLNINAYCLLICKSKFKLAVQKSALIYIFSDMVCNYQVYVNGVIPHSQLVLLMIDRIINKKIILWVEVIISDKLQKGALLRLYRSTLKLTIFFLLLAISLPGQYHIFLINVMSSFILFLWFLSLSSRLSCNSLRL